MATRDDFSPKVREIVAKWAGWHCSFEGCPKLTVGPSDEGPEKVTLIADAAHICAASPGGRRYDPSMTPEERSSIGNAIWLCNDHARYIDRNSATYTADALRAMKRRHEAKVDLAVRTGSGMNLGRGLFAIGSNVVCTGNATHISDAAWIIDIAHFLVGDAHALISFIGSFDKVMPEDRYVLSNEVGDGRALSAAPSLQKQGDGYALTCPVLPRFPRIEVQKLGSRMASHPETNDVYLNDEGSIARVSGLDALPQCVQSLLSMQRGESPFYPTSGVRFFEYFDAFHGSAWLEKLLMLDVVRQISIPYTDRTSNTDRLPIRCIERVCSIELLAEVPVNHLLPVRLDLDVKGLGRWQREMSVYMPTKDQMEEMNRRQAEFAYLWR